METAIEWLIRILEGQKDEPFDYNEWEIAFKHALDMEKQQAERSYSEKEVKQIIDATLIEHSDFVLADVPEWFKQFKKK